MVALINDDQLDDLEPRTRRAVTEEMSFRCSRKVVGTRYSWHPGTTTKSTSSANPVPVQTSSSASPPADVSTSVALTTKSSVAESRDRMADSQLMRLILINQQTIPFIPHVG